jgi:hypothetical protein
MRSNMEDRRLISRGVRIALSTPQRARAASSRHLGILRPRRPIAGRFSRAWLRVRPAPDRLESRWPISREFEQRIELAGSKNLGDGRVDIAENDLPAILSRQALQGHEISQRRRSREPDAAEIDYHLRSPMTLSMRFVMLAQFLNRRGVQPEAVPEFRNQDAIHVVSLERGLQH